MSPAPPWSFRPEAPDAQVRLFPNGRVWLRNRRQPLDVLKFTAAEWVAFCQGVRAGEFDDLTGEPQERYFWSDWPAERTTAFFKHFTPEAAIAAIRAQGNDLKCTDEKTIARAAAIIVAAERQSGNG